MGKETTQLILLRHGESQWNLENRFTGWYDVSLTEKRAENPKRWANVAFGWVVA